MSDGAARVVLLLLFTVMLALGLLLSAGPDIFTATDAPFAASRKFPR